MLPARYISPPCCLAGAPFLAQTKFNLHLADWGAVNNSDLIIYGLWILPAWLYAGLTFTLWQSALVRKWRWLFAYILACALFYGILFPLQFSHNAIAYFWIFWIGRAMQMACRLGVLWQLKQALAESDVRLSSRISLLRLTGATAVALGIGWVSYSASASNEWNMTQEIVAGDHALSLAAILLFALILLFRDRLPIDQRNEIFSVALAMAVQGAASSAYALYLGLHPLSQTNLPVAEVMRDSAEIGSILILVRTFAMRQSGSSRPNPEPRILEQVL